MKSKILLMTTVFGLLSACGIYESKNKNQVPLVDINAILADPNSRVTFQNVNQGVFQVSCLRCHSAAQAKGGVVLETYAHVESQISDVINDINTGDMPLNSTLSAEQIALFKLWIAQGHREFGIGGVTQPSATPEPSVTPAPSATPTPTPVGNPKPTPTATPALSVLVPTYQSIHDLVFVPKCMTCHGTGGSKHAQFPLETYAEMMAQGELIIPGNPGASTVVKEIMAGTMPTKRSGLPMVTAQELLVIQTWIQNGARP